MVEVKEIVALIATLGIAADMSAFDPQKTFNDNGIDSLDVMSLLLAVEEQFGIKLSDDEVNRIGSADELVQALNAHGSAQGPIS